MKQRLLNFLLRHLFPIVDVEKVLTVRKDGALLLNNELVETQKLHTLKSEVTLFENTMLWSLLTETLKHQAQLTMFANSKDFQDMLNGKMMLYNISVQNEIINRIKKAR